MVRHLATLQITPSQPLMLLRAVVVYDLPTGTVSLCLAVGLRLCRPDSLDSGTRCQKNLDGFKRLLKTIIFSCY